MNMNIDTTGLQLYNVDFNNNGGSIFSNGTIPIYFVMARSYDEAVAKAERTLEQEPTQSVVGCDGSLNLDSTEIIKARSVRLVSDKIIW